MPEDARKTSKGFFFAVPPGGGRGEGKEGEEGVESRGGAGKMKLNGSLFRRRSISFAVKTSVDIRH